LEDLASVEAERGISVEEGAGETAGETIAP